MTRRHWSGVTLRAGGDDAADAVQARRCRGAAAAGADLDAELRRPAEQRAASGTTSVVPGIAPSKTSPVRPSIVMTSPGTSVRSPITTRSADHDHAGRPDHGRDPPAAGDDRGVARQAATRREDAGRPGHAVDVVGRRLGPDEDRGRAVGRGGLGGLRARSTIAAARHPRRGRQAGDQRQDELLRGARRRRRVGEQRAHPLDGLGPGQRERLVLGHVDRDPQRRLPGCACRPGPGASRAGPPRS